ncbi:MAG: hypothetical protein HN353_12225 [Bdellovibrionales bacterium]|jgi:hypothetical protein|nr:hypothetical protein [Bdellovibrionales bacterium]MBT3526137.1 hypothetical protein [Bdellovibrionales bacterium]MBT7668327.1 hypothetical protein [Bdellovibrionales bacterium]MBT7768202.1 hypothetical protein [Bdellovibrionales bacterium]
MEGQLELDLQESSNPLNHFFMTLESRMEGPFSRALSQLDSLEQESADGTELLFLLLEDTVFSSIYATFYEELFLKFSDTTEEGREQLIELFEQSSEQRDRLIAQQTGGHVDYIMRGGSCPGCSSCQFHQDVDDLVARWQQQDLNFFVTLYIGMQTIQTSFEQLLYDYLDSNDRIIRYFTPENILGLRKFIMDYSERELV